MTGMIQIQGESFKTSSLFALTRLDLVVLTSSRCISLVVGNTIRLSFISYILFYAPKDRPINVLIAIGHVSQVNSF